MMNKFKSLVLLLVLVCSISFVSCGSDSDSDEPHTYISYANVDGSKSGEFTGGVTPQSEVPLASYRPSGSTFCMAFRKTTSVIEINAAAKGRSDFDHIYMSIDGDKEESTFSGSDVYIGIRIEGLNSDKVDSLTSPSVTITKYSNSYIEGIYSGEDCSGNAVTGSFVVKNFGDNKWPILW